MSTALWQCLLTMSTCLSTIQPLLQQTKNIIQARSHVSQIAQSKQSRSKKKKKKKKKTKRTEKRKEMKQKKKKACLVREKRWSSWKHCINATCHCWSANAMVHLVALSKSPTVMFTTSKRSRPTMRSPPQVWTLLGQASFKICVFCRLFSCLSRGLRVYFSFSLCF